MRDRIEFPCGCVYSRFSGLPEVVTCRCRGLRCRPRRLAKVVSDFLDGFYAHPDAG